jgi:hypothetical protein
LDQKLLEKANREAAAILKSLRAEKDVSSKPKEVSAKSFWSSFPSLPMAEAASLLETQFPANFELSNLNGVNGFIIDGEALGGNSGLSVSGAGDINGDNISDFVEGLLTLPQKEYKMPVAAMSSLVTKADGIVPSNFRA